MRDQRFETSLPRAVRLAVIAAMAIFVIAASLLVTTAWRGLLRIEPIHSQLSRLQALQATALGIEEALAARLNDAPIADVANLDSLRLRVLEIGASGEFLDPDSAQRLARVAEMMDHLDPSDADGIIALLEEFRRLLEMETLASQSLTDTLQGSTALELRIAIGLVLALPAFALLFFTMLRYRILRPLEDLGRLMSMLGKPQYRTVPMHGVMLPLRPVFENFNAMVERLSELESHHRARHRSLEREVREATGALLRQEHELARAERLAVVGEIAASVAHELRNPLAGIQVALSGLKGDLENRKDIERLDLVLAELRRTTRLLNNLLDQARPASEHAVDVDVSGTVADLLALVRYRLPERIRLDQQVPENLHWLAPDGRLQQALLNLILNAAHAIGDRPGSIGVDIGVVGERLVLRVTDDGPGFPDELLASGVGSFTTWRKDGMGLGLATVQRFARESGGSLRLENRDPCGAVVTIELPREDQHG